MKKRKVNYLRHRWSFDSCGRHFCLRRGCDFARSGRQWQRDRIRDPREVHPVCRSKDLDEKGGVPWYERKAIYGGGIGPFEKKSPRDRILGPSGKTSESRRARKSLLESPKRRNRSARRKRRDRWQALCANLAAGYNGVWVQEASK
jgi:hypothetical protein